MVPIPVPAATAGVRFSGEGGTAARSLGGFLQPRDCGAVADIAAVTLLLGLR